MSKEDILNSKDLIFFGRVSAEDEVTGTPEKIYEAMDEYAKQIAIGFLTWYGVKMSGFIQYIKDIRPIVISNEIEEKVKEFEGKPIEELFNIYLESLKPKT